MLGVDELLLMFGAPRAGADQLDGPRAGPISLEHWGQSLDEIIGSGFMSGHAACCCWLLAATCCCLLLAAGCLLAACWLFAGGYLLLSAMDV